MTTIKILAVQLIKLVKFENHMLTPIKFLRLIIKFNQQCWDWRLFFFFEEVEIGDWKWEASYICETSS